MEIYLILFIWSVISIWIAQKIKYCRKIYLILNLLPLIIFAGIRSSDVGTDLNMYLNIFVSIDNPINFFIYSEVSGVDYLYLFFNLFINFISNSQVLFLFVVAFITYTLIGYSFYKHSLNIYISVIMFIGLYMYCTSFNLIRQYLAIAFLCIAYSFLLDGRKLCVVIFSIIAVLFHKSAMIMLPLFYFYDKMYNLKRYYILSFMIIGVCIVFFSYYSFLVALIPKYSSIYTSSGYGSSREITASILYAIVASIYLVYINLFLISKKIHFDKTIAFHNILIFCYILAWICSFKIYIFHRLVYYFEIFLCFAVPNAIEKYFKNKYIIYAVIIVILFINLFLFLEKNTADCVPYTTIFRDGF